MRPDEAVKLLREAVAEYAKKKEKPCPDFLDDDILFRFVACRHYDMPSAAKRYFNFMKLVKDYNLLFTLTDDVAAGLSLGVMNPMVDSAGQPVMVVIPRRINWDKVTPKQMQKAWFFAMWHLVSSTSSAQLDGIVVCNDATDMGPSMLRTEFHTFITTAIQQCMPMKLKAAFICNEPGLFSWVIWPIFSVALSSKMKARVTLVGAKYPKMHAVVPKDSLPACLGGDQPEIPPTAFAEKMFAEHGYQPPAQRQET